MGQAGQDGTMYFHNRAELQRNKLTYITKYDRQTKLHTMGKYNDPPLIYGKAPNHSFEYSQRTLFEG